MPCSLIYQSTCDCRMNAYFTFPIDCFPLFYSSCLCQKHFFSFFPFYIDKMQKYVPARAGDKLEPWNYFFSCWGEKGSSVSLADIPLNLIHYCMVTLLLRHARNWATCGALKHPDRGQFHHLSMMKCESSSRMVAFSKPGLHCKLAFTAIYFAMFVRRLWAEIVKIKFWLDSFPQNKHDRLQIQYAVLIQQSLIWCRFYKQSLC